MPIDERSPLTSATSHPFVLRLAEGGVAAVIDPEDADGAAARQGGAVLLPEAAACGTFRPGHRVHWIQVGKAARTPGVPHRLLDADEHEVLVRDPGGATLTWWLHDTTPLRALLLLEGPSTVHLHGHGVLMAGHTPLHPCRGSEDRTGCSPQPRPPLA